MSGYSLAQNHKEGRRGPYIFFMKILFCQMRSYCKKLVKRLKINRLRSLCIEICKLINNINPAYMNETFKLRKISRAVLSNYKLNDTHREILIFHSIQYRNGWLAASDLFYMFTQSIKFYIHGVQ